MIIAGKDLEYAQNNGQFELLLDKTITVLKDINAKSPFKTNKNLWSEFEEESFKAMKLVQDQNQKEIFSKWKIELVSGASFPDITTEIAAKKKFGVEVKTSKANKWTTLGGSIMESTRVPDVERINVLFAKLDPFDVRTKRFEDCVSNVAVTHSPRYLIDFNIDPGQTIFKKIKVDYSTIRNSEKPFEYFKKYFEEKSQRDGTELWFIESKDNELDVEEHPTLEIKFYNDLGKERKDLIVSKAMILFPELFEKTAKYKKIALWLLKMGILNTSLRDIFSGGENVELYGYTVSSKFQRLHELKPLILHHLSINPISIDITSKYDTSKPIDILNLWKQNVIRYASYETDVKKCAAAILRDFNL